jgi:cytochrome c oxidase subunit IV
MRTEWRIFGILTAFLFAAAALYAWWTDTDLGAIDWIGTIALTLTGLLTLMCGGYFWFVSRRIDPRPEDRDDADISDGAGEIGFFSPGSYWPLGIALATIIAGIGIVYLMWWLIAVGLIAVLFATGGLLFEYYTGARKSSH